MPGKKIDSAGVGALKNYPADSSAEKVAEKHGISLEGHRGTQFSSKISKDYDLLLVMEQEHIEQISKIAPEARGKTMLLGHWLDRKEIPDPYKKSDEAFELVYQLIEQSCQCWADKLVR
ncbi:Low molecular weight protein-tyrosine-phosphatase Etp [Klebsiella spallanzanii]|uniref:protein-tyrosine-phosphatase n=2 Tax=Klebsiella spallanzanii TaxID=2587528 RepID=A0ABY6VDV4_9ENTR|nr:Low molecular weight protein-tyrosine-phosphatase Etp [Klebsiella spallanzanii]